MLFKISLKNIGKSFKDYAVYFFTLILGVAVFYVFNSLDSQTVMMDVNKRTYEIIDLMNEMLSGVSVFVSLILGFLIIYASRFLIKRRNKEFGTYMILGMGKRKISMILFIETFLIGIISLAVGLVVGVVASQFMSVLVANLFEADMTKFKFVFSAAACVKTLIYFAIMYVIVMVFNTINISRCKIIDLINASRKSEKVSMKNPWLCTVVFIIAVGVLSYAYWMVTKGVYKMNTIDKISIPIAMGSIATFFIFWSLSGLLIRIFSSIKGVYYKGINSFVLRQFCSKINTTVFSTTIICLMLFITISVLSGALSMKDSMSGNINETAPVDVQFSKSSYAQIQDAFSTSESDSDSERYDRILEDSKLSITETLKANGFDVEGKLKDIVNYSVYKTDVTLKDALGNSFERIQQMYPNIIYTNNCQVMKISDYNKVATLYGNKTYKLDDDEFIMLADYKSFADMYNIALKSGVSIEMNGKKLKSRYNECQDGFVQIAAQHINNGIILVADSSVNESQCSSMGMCADYNASSKADKAAIDEQLTNIVEKIFNKSSWLTFNSRQDLIDSSVGLGALVTFIALYLGIIFLISSAAILALKELSDSSDNKERYGMIRKIGVDERMIDMALFKQIGIFFAFPLILAIIHSIFGIKFIGIILDSLGMGSMLASVGMTFVFLLVIYGGYFVVTYIYSRNIIKENR